MRSRIGLSLLGCLLFLPQLLADSGNLEIHFIDVGQGDSTLVNCPSGPAILVDAGTLPSIKKDPSRLRSYLKAHLGGRWIDTVVVTHADSDHYNMLRSTLKGFRLKALIYTGELKDYSYSTRSWIRNEDTANARFHLRWNKQARTWNPKPSIDCGDAVVRIVAAGVPGTKAEIGNYPYPEAWEKNSASIVLHVSYGDFDAVLTGDATRDTEALVMAQNPSLRDLEC